MSQDIKNEYYESAITELKRHADTSNKEVGLIQGDIRVIQVHLENINKDLGAIKPQISSLESTVQRWIGGLAVIMTLITILSKFIK